MNVRILFLASQRSIVKQGHDWGNHQTEDVGNFSVWHEESEMSEKSFAECTKQARKQYREEAEKAEPLVKASLAGKERVLPKPLSQPEGWLTYTLYWMKSPMSLDEFIGIADALNHELATKDEIAWTFVQLRNRGWLLVDGERYGLTAEARSVVSEVIGTYEHDPVEQIRRLEGWFRIHPLV